MKRKLTFLVSVQKLRLHYFSLEVKKDFEKERFVIAVRVAIIYQTLVRIQ